MLSYDFFQEFFENAPVLDNKYKILYRIGEGRYAKVKLAINMEDKKKYAVKIMRKDQVDTAAKLENFLNEVQLLSSVYHNHVVQIVHVSVMGKYQKPNGKIKNVIYYVMKYAEYGELFEILQKTTSFSERIARYYFRQLIEGIEYMHNMGIGHRDIKTENILLDSKYNLILADFGCACKSREQNLQRIPFSNQKPVGSPEYNAPEITNNTVPGDYYAEDTDIFSSACALFVMIFQSIPFNSSLFSDPYYTRLCKKDTSKFWKIFDPTNMISTELKDLIERMMDSSPKKRLNIQEVKKHPWFSGPIPLYEEIAAEMKIRGEIILSQNQENIRDYNSKKSQKMRKFSSRSDRLDGEDSKEENDKALENLKQIMHPKITDINVRLMKETEMRAANRAKSTDHGSLKLEKNNSSGRKKSQDFSAEKPSPKSKLQLQKDMQYNYNMEKSSNASDGYGSMSSRQSPGHKDKNGKDDKFPSRKTMSDD